MTVKELQKLYTRVKLMTDPTSYTFRDRLISHHLPSEVCLLGNHNIDYDAEESLVTVICKANPSLEKSSYGEYAGAPATDADFLGALNDEMLDEDTVVPSDRAWLFIRTDNLEFCESLFKLTYSDWESPKSKLFESFVTMAYRLSSAKSIASDLAWLNTAMYRTHTYESLHELKFLKEALRIKCGPFYVKCDVSPIDVTASMPRQTHGIYKIEDNPCAGFKCIDAEAVSANKMLIEARVRNTVFYGLEIVYQYNKIPDTLKGPLWKECFQSESNALTALIYKSDAYQNVTPACELSDVPEERFHQICEYVDSIQPAITALVEKACKIESFSDTVSYMMGGLVSFCADMSVKHIRTLQCAILYNYCVTNDLLKDVNTSKVADLFSALGSGSDSDDFGSDSEGSEDDTRDRRTSMMDLHKHSAHGRPTGRGGSHESSPIFQALDGMVGNFRSSKYEFSVKEVFSSEEAHKEKYTKIASSIKLVNTQLIKQIREIKVYNSGGKDPGKSVGKLDRKALCRYKTDKNIFYQNTYKQQELDPAFGIMLDASGSMSGQGIKDGRITMIVLHETLKALGINHSIMDHTCYKGQYHSDIRVYQKFREDKGYRIRKNYALAGITAESGNCDSGALYFMEKALLRTRNRDKICLIFSDGAPTECTGTDLVEQVRHMEKNGIVVIGIGVNFSNISKYYTNYANGKNLKEMLDIVASILKDYVITKKE